MIIFNQNRCRILFLMMAIAFCGLVFHQRIIGQAAYADQKDKSVTGQEHLAQIESISKAFRQVAKQVKPAVVRIETTFKIEPEEKSTSKKKIAPQDVPEQFRDFFEKWHWDFQMPERKPKPREGTGSGSMRGIGPGHRPALPPGAPKPDPNRVRPKHGGGPADIESKRKEMLERMRKNRPAPGGSGHKPKVAPLKPVKPEAPKDGATVGKDGNTVE